MKIIFIHGMNQQKYDSESLKQRWLKIFQQGVNQLKIDIDIDQLDIALPFYADLLNKHQVENHFDLNRFRPKLGNKYHIINSHKITQPKIIQSNTPIRLLPNFDIPHHQKLSTRLYLSSQWIKDQTLKEFTTILNNFPKLHESLIHKFLIETYLYLANPEFMNEVHLRILASLEKDQRHIIVGHSLGSVIAYNLLQHLEPQYCIQRFITLGSPLSFKVIQSKLAQPITHPSSLNGEWLNFYSPNDFLTKVPLINYPFNFQPKILNTSISTFIDAPHEIMGYLQHPSVIQSILEPILNSESYISKSF